MAEEVNSLKFNSESRCYKSNIALYQHIYKDKILQPPEWLEGLESPFKWGLHIHERDLVAWDMSEKLCDYANQGAFYGFEKLAFLLTFVFMKTVRDEQSKIFEKLFESDESEDEDDSEEEEYIDEYDPEKAYAKCRETVDEMAANEGDVMYSRIGPALEHVVQVTRAHMLFFQGKNPESEELARQVKPVNEMSQECMAGFEGLKAKVIMSMYQNYRIVLPYLHRAMELDPEFGYWPYLVGKVLRRSRREFKDDVIGEEVKYFEKAVSLERNPKFLVFLAQAYQETAQAMYHSEGLIGSTDNLRQKAVELYRECWRLKSDSAAISRRVGNGMSKMRSGVIDKTVAKEALLKAVELSPNTCTYVALGKFYYIHEKNDEKALEYFEHIHPGDFGSSEIIRLNLIRNPDYDPYEILQCWVTFENVLYNAVKQYKSLCDAAWYYLVFNPDLEKAAKHIWKVLVADNRSIRAKTALEYRSYAFCVEGPVNLLEVLVNEILLLKKENESLPLEERKNIQSLENILEKLVVKYPDLQQVNPNPNMVKDLKRDVDCFTAAKRRQRYGSTHNRRSEPSRRPEEPGSWRNNRSNDVAQEKNDSGPYRQEEGNNSRTQRHNSSRESYVRSDIRTRLSFSVGDDEGSNRGSYTGVDRRRHSESQSNWSSARTHDVGEGTSSQSGPNRRFDHSNRGRTDGQYNSYNNNRYDVTITDWRNENRRH